MESKFECKLGIREYRHCIQRQLGNERYSPKGDLNPRYSVCRECTHFLTDAQQRKGKDKLQYIRDKDVVVNLTIEARRFLRATKPFHPGFTERSW